MTAAKIRQGGAWVDGALTGKSRIGGSWVDFGPAGGPTYETLAWPDVPSSTSNDDGVTYTLGMRFSLVAAKNCVGVEWNPVPTITNAPAGGVYYAKLWSYDTTTELASKTFTPATGTTQQVLFDTPVALSASPSLYVASIFSRAYDFRTPSPASGWSVTSPSGNIVSTQSRLHEGNDPTAWLDQSFNGWYYMSPIVEV